MKTLKFKTNIKCNGCIATVSPALNSDKNIAKWDVDTNSPEKILTIETSEETPNNIINLVEKAGFKIEPISI